MKSSRQRSCKGRVQAVILDWSGTVIDYGCIAPLVAFLQLFDIYEVSISVKEARTPMGLNKREHIQGILKINSVQERWLSRYGKPPSEKDIDSMYSAFNSILKKVVAERTELIDGTLEAANALRNRSVKIGSTTGYSREIMDLIVPIAKRKGFETDALVCANDVPNGRPEPWMALQCAMELGVFPMTNIVKIGDTLPDIAEGLNAGMWTIGLTRTGNELGMTANETNALPEEELAEKLKGIHNCMVQAGAHFVVESIAQILPCIDKIDQYLAQDISPLDDGSDFSHCHVMY